MNTGEDIFEKYKKGNSTLDYLHIPPNEWEEIKEM